jgi:hypothetical protein
MELRKAMDALKDLLFEALDVDGDGKVGVIDAVKVAKWTRGAVRTVKAAREGDPAAVAWAAQLATQLPRAIEVLVVAAGGKAPEVPDTLDD